MFLKIVESGQNIKYVYVVEGFREGDKIRHKYVFSLGKLDDLLKMPSFKKLASLSLKNDQDFIAFNKENISEGEIYHYGHLVLKKVWDLFEFDKLFIELLKKDKRKISYDFLSAIFYMVSRHILDPDSKLGIYEDAKKYLKMDKLDLNHLYRSLDVLSEYKEEIEEYLFQKNTSLFNMSVDVVFYDVTTFYFESQNEDMIRKYGFNKDGKIGNVQVVFGLLVDMEGRPIGYEIFSGNTFDGKTLEPFLESVKKRFNIKRIIIVADKGINNKVNLLKLIKMGYGYIVASRIKNLSEEILKEVFNPEGYHSIKEKEEEEFRYKVIEYENRIKIDRKTEESLKENLIVSYSKKRAEKDKYDREMLIKKAEMLIKEPSKIKAMIKRGGRKYIKCEEEKGESWKIDEELIERDKKFDGYYAIQTSEKNMNAIDIMNVYHQLWKIEESFRIMKSNLEVRPMYHWTENRIKGHFVVCFLAFMLIRTLEIMLKEEGIGIEKIREGLNSFTLTEIKINDELFYIRNKINSYGNVIANKLKFKKPKNITSKKEIDL